MQLKTKERHQYLALHFEIGLLSCKINRGNSPAFSSDTLRTVEEQLDWTNSDQKMQMALELAIFGTNIIDIHKIDGQYDIEVSKKLDEYGLDCWITFSGGKLQEMNDTNDVRKIWLYRTICG